MKRERAENVLMDRSSFGILLLTITLLAIPLTADALEFIVIDAGHGGYDTGIRTQSANEKDTALDLSKMLEETLKGMGKKVYLTRKIDQYISIEERISLTNRQKPDLFLSIHQSNSDNFVVYITMYEEKDANLSLRQYYSFPYRQMKRIYESGVFAVVLEDALKAEFGAKVIHREMPLPVLNSMAAPAVLIEMPSSGLDYEKELQRVASAVALGITNYEQKR